MGRQFRRWLKVNPLSFMVVSAKLIWGFTLKVQRRRRFEIRDAKRAHQSFHSLAARPLYYINSLYLAKALGSA